jgi:hypothetical protein
VQTLTGLSICYYIAIKIYSLESLLLEFIRVFPGIRLSNGWQDGIQGKQSSACRTKGFDEKSAKTTTFNEEINMTETRWNPEKPLAITAICIIGIINAIQMINLVLSPMSKQAGAIYPFYFTLSVALSVACIVGLWLLKRWAAFVYAALLMCNQIVLLVMGYWSFSAAIIPAVIIALLIKHLDRMS